MVGEYLIKLQYIESNKTKSTYRIQWWMVGEYLIKLQYIESNKTKSTYRILSDGWLESISLNYSILKATKLNLHTEFLAMDGWRVSH